MRWPDPCSRRKGRAAWVTQTAPSRVQMKKAVRKRPVSQLMEGSRERAGRRGDPAHQGSKEAAAVHAATSGREAMTEVGSGP